MALRVAPSRRWLFQAAKRVLETLDIYIRGIETVQKAAELVEQIVVHGREQVCYHVRICVRGGIRDSLLEIIASAELKPCPLKDCAIQNGHGGSPTFHP